jgi:hypothetical protein
MPSSFLSDVIACGNLRPLCDSALAGVDES